MHDVLYTDVEWIAFGISSKTIAKCSIFSKLCNMNDKYDEQWKNSLKKFDYHDCEKDTTIWDLYTELCTCTCTSIYYEHRTY